MGTKGEKVFDHFWTSNLKDFWIVSVLSFLYAEENNLIYILEVILDKKANEL